MEPKFQTSFIPKKPILASSGSIKKTIDFLMIIAVVLFLGSVVLSVGVYAYKIILTKNIATLQSSLAKSKEQFDEDFIGYINRLNSRIETSKNLLKQHVSASPIFGFIASHTLKTVQYTDFTYTNNPDGSVKVVMKGLAQSYSSIALQSEEFGKQNQYIKSPIFSDLNPDQSGNVVFTFTALLDKNLISYQKNLSQNPATNSDVQADTAVDATASTTETGVTSGTNTL